MHFAPANTCIQLIYFGIHAEMHVGILGLSASCPILCEIRTDPQILAELLNAKFRTNPFRYSRIISREQGNVQNIKVELSLQQTVEAYRVISC
jgi:hypothetical protein